jgi:hypothetical protein
LKRSVRLLQPCTSCHALLRSHPVLTDISSTTRSRGKTGNRTIRSHRPADFLDIILLLKTFSIKFDHTGLKGSKNAEKKGASQRRGLSTVPMGNTVVQLRRSASSKAAQAEHSTVKQTRSGPQHFHTRAAKSLAADTFFLLTSSSRNVKAAYLI